MPDPKLKEAMAEISAIIDKHDIAGAVSLVSQTHSEYLYKLEPSWSVISMPGGGELRFRSKEEDFESKEQQQKQTEQSVSILHQIRDLNAQSFQNMQNIIEQLEKDMDIDHTPFSNHEPHTEN